LYFLLLRSNSDGLYGIGLRGIRLDGMNPTFSDDLALMTSVGFLAGLILTQGTTCGLKKLSRRY
jgi:hypothetical protein